MFKNYTSYENSSTTTSSGTASSDSAGSSNCSCAVDTDDQASSSNWQATSYYSSSHSSSRSSYSTTAATSATATSSSSSQSSSSSSSSLTSSSTSSISDTDYPTPERNEAEETAAAAAATTAAATTAAAAAAAAASIDLASICEARHNTSPCHCITNNNHNLNIDWRNVDKKEFMKTVSGMDIVELFAAVKADPLQKSGGRKAWNFSEFVLQRKDRRIFVGGQGFVLFVRRSRHSSGLAMKVCLHSACKLRIERYTMKADLQLRAQCESRFVSNLLNYYITDNFFVSVMFKAKHSSLKVIKRQIGSYPAKFIKYYAACMMEALVSLHTVGICHKDVKADNVLINDRGLPLLADFGLATDATNCLNSYSANKRVTSMQYYPPECLVIGAKVNDYKTDTWLYGFLLSELSVVSSTHMWQKYRNSMKADWRFTPCEHCHLPRDEGLVQLMLSCLQHSAVDRPLICDLARVSNRYFDAGTRSMTGLDTAPDTVHIRRLLADFVE